MSNLPVSAVNNPEADRLRDRYLDLMVKILTNTIYEDPPGQSRKLRRDVRKFANRILGDAVVTPKQSPRFDKADRQAGVDWPSLAHSMAGVARLNNLIDLTKRAIVNNVPGHFIETGVWRGGCCILMKAVIESFAAKGRRVYVANYFAGCRRRDRTFIRPTEEKSFIEPISSVFRATKFAPTLKNTVCSTMTSFFSRVCSRTRCPSCRKSTFALIRLDGDMYKSTIVALDALYSKVSPNGFVVIDDYGAIPACRQAVNDFRQRHDIRDEINKINSTGVWWQKSTPKT